MEQKTPLALLQKHQKSLIYFFFPFFVASSFTFFVTVGALLIFLIAFFGLFCRASSERGPGLIL
jgi:hypothetical protein